eukprot:TRINITY_DN1015_c0_g1_i1.p1 TRINITY_DN1015_c0_g1~~TRINITY_DN1015_c0_g1_i1.p1  ORF type:complete len:435 (-),score=70.65 TRINITY_DN1015_c0_g1_i1:43-1317(-)
MADEELENLAAYSSDDEETVSSTKQEAEVKKDDTYSTLHSAGFKDFLLKPALLRAIVDCGFEHPSEVQNQCIPDAVTGTDILCQAKSGMGKTAVFVLAVLQQMEEKPEGVNCLVLCHVRELAFQICHEFDRFVKYMPNVKTAVFYGGIPLHTHRAILENDPPNIVIGTPGRVLDLIERGDLDLKKCKYFVLDECDKMLDSLDMRSDVQKIFKATPHTKQVMMFSATLSSEIRPVCKMFMHNPLEIYVNDGSKLTLHGLKQYYLELEESSKTRKLVELLDALEFNQCVVFVSSVKRAKELNSILVDCNFPAITIHGGRGLSQDKRIERYRQFKEFKARVMVATNLFGRGIDIERVNVVFNYDMPEDADTYLHRVGRAGRFGTKGLAISFVASKTDGVVLNEVQKVFVVDIPELPEEIDASTYMQA